MLLLVETAEFLPGPSSCLFPSVDREVGAHVSWCLSVLVWRKAGERGKPTSWALAAQNPRLLGAPAAPQVAPLISLLRAFETVTEPIGDQVGQCSG